ncbi:MAG TPA: amidohydrolase family protein, partial [Chthoniobacterales bacterium]
HVSPTLMRALYQAKGGDGICLITDATAAAGLEDGAVFQLARVPCVVAGGVGMLADGSAIAGSTCRMIDGVKKLTELADVPLVEAVRMATVNPAQALRQPRNIGVLQPGYRADFAIFSTGFRIRQTWVGGQIVYEKWDE